MLTESQWYSILIAHLYASDAFSAFHLDKIMGLAAWFYNNKYAPGEAAQRIIEAKIIMRGVRKCIESPDDAA